MVSVAVAAGFASLVSPAFAGKLDQSQPNTDGDLNFGGTENPPQRAQTFTAGLTGQLDQVDVFVMGAHFALSTSRAISTPSRAHSGSRCRRL